MQLRHIDTARGPTAFRQQAVQDQQSILGATADGVPLPLVLLHGWPESSLSWAATAACLPGVACIAPDLRGMGAAPRGGTAADYAKDQLAQDVWALLDRLQIQRAVVVGHDWGGIVAQEMALAAPERVAGLGIANIAVINNLQTNRHIARHSQNRFMWYQHFLHTELPEAMIVGNERAWVSHFLRAWRPEGFPQAVLEAVIEDHKVPGTATATANYYRSYAADIRRWQSLADHCFAMPAAYVHGVHDVVITPDYLDGIEACFADLVVTRIEAGHFVQDEQPEAVAKAIRALYQRCE